jgi:hypothetical protein
MPANGYFDAVVPKGCAEDPGGSVAPMSSAPWRCWPPAPQRWQLDVASGLIRSQQH